MDSVTDGLTAHIVMTIADHNVLGATVRSEPKNEDVSIRPTLLDTAALCMLSLNIGLIDCATPQGSLQSLARSIVN